MNSQFTEDALIEQPATPLFLGDLLLPKLISGAVSTFAEVYPPSAAPEATGGYGAQGCGGVGD